MRVTFKAASAEGLKVDNASIVQRSGSTGNGTTTPTELLFSGVSGFDCAANSTVTSDTLAYTTTPGDYLVTFDVSSDAAKDAQKYITPGAMYYAASTNWYNVQTIGITDPTHSQYAAITTIEVR